MLNIRTVARKVPALALAATLLVSALGPASSVVAAAEPVEPSARLQVVVKEVKIHDDRDVFGEGELTLKIQISSCKDELPLECVRIVDLRESFGAGSGDTVALERIVPDQPAGFPLYAGEHYVVRFDMEEHDGKWSTGDNMGAVIHIVDIGERGLGLGTHTVPSVIERQYQRGDYTVTYEIRRTSLSDLEPVNIKVYDLPGSAKKRVCMGIINREVMHAGPFEVELSVDGVVPPDGRYTVGLLGSGMDYVACVETVLPTSGQFELAAWVDKARAVREFNESNNVYRQTFAGTSSASSPSSSSPTNQGEADLIVSAIKVNGRAPDGNDDCNDGKNRVAVVVKNVGASNAGDFTVRLVVDGDASTARDELLADGLDAGQELEVRFDGVRLKKGERSLLAIADSRKAIAESKDDNNELKVTAGCHDGN